MRYFPLFADLHGRRVLVVGGGAVAERKIGLLIEAGAVVVAVAPEFTATLAERGRSETRLELVTARFDAIFEKYAAEATEVRLDAWKRRAWSHRALDQAMYLFNELL